MGKISLSIFAWLVSMKLVYVESSLWIGLGICLAGGVNLLNRILEMGGVKRKENVVRSFRQACFSSHLAPTRLA